MLEEKAAYILFALTDLGTCVQTSILRFDTIALGWAWDAVCVSPLIRDGTIPAVLPAMLPAVGIMAVQVGMLPSINRLVRPPLNKLSGWLSTRVNRHWPYMAGLLIGVCSTLGYGLV